MTKIAKKIAAGKQNLIFLSETTIYLSLGLRKGRQSYRRSLSALKREHPALQNMKFFIFYTFVGHFLDQDSGNGSTDLI
jgi:hypothetical protein